MQSNITLLNLRMNLLLMARLENIEEELYYYDNTLKAWTLIPEHEDGSHQISSTGIYAEGISSPFVKIEGTLHTSGGLPLNGESVIFQHDFGSTSTFTTASGKYISILPQKSRISYSVSNLCSNLNENIQTDTEDLKLNSLNLEIPFDEIYLIKGQARDCSNDPLTQESIIVYNIEGENSIKWVKDSEFTIPLIACTEALELNVRIEDKLGEEISEGIDYQLNDIIDLFHVLVCDTIRDEYVSIEIEGVDQFLFEGSAEILNDNIHFSFFDPDLPGYELIS